MWNRWLPLLALPWVEPLELPLLTLKSLVWLLLFLLLWTPTALLIVVEASSVGSQESQVAVDVPPFAVCELVAAPVLFLLSWPWAAPPPTTALVPAPNRAAPNAAAAAFRMFMCFLAFPCRKPSGPFPAGLGGDHSNAQGVTSMKSCGHQPGGRQVSRRAPSWRSSRVGERAGRRPSAQERTPLARTKGGPFCHRERTPSRDGALQVTDLLDPERLAAALGAAVRGPVGVAAGHLEVTLLLVVVAVRVHPGHLGGR